MPKNYGLGGMLISWCGLFVYELLSLHLMDSKTLASLASQRSNCMKRRVGAVLVRENRVVSTG